MIKENSNVNKKCFKINFIQKNKSIRFKILSISFFSCIILSIIVTTSIGILKRTMTSIGDSYKTNVALDKYLTLIYEVESAMESYLQYRTFESIDKYYKNLSLAEEFSKTLQEKPSAITELQKEYVIRQLSNSFFTLSSNAISARRANSLVEIDNYSSKAILCYSFLREEILSLNMLYFKTNAGTYESNRKNTNAVLNISVILMVLFLIATLYFVYVNISKVTSPLSKISDVALKVADRNFNVELFNSTRQDEIGNICRAFDQMIISIQKYIDTIWEKAKKENELQANEIKMKALITESHFKALQEQIQPHFLFNTLNTGAGLALMEGADKTCYFLEQVADFLRYNIQHPGKDATIRDELGMLDNYIYIMSVRFGKRYEFIKNIESSPNEKILEQKMPNTILQPLVENCLKHGLKDITENGKIKISILQNEKTNEINIFISDNGIGFSKEIKSKILNASKTGEVLNLNSLQNQNQSNKINSESEQNNSEHISTGLVNVIARLKFYFKDENVFDIFSNESILQNENFSSKKIESVIAEKTGTTFFIRIPNV